MKGRSLWVRAIGSSLIGEFLDSFIFVLIASLTGVFGWELFATLVITNYLFKLSLEILVFPITFFVVQRIKRAEGIDTYDVGVKFNPFASS